MTKDEVVTRFGPAFENSPWIAERAWDDELGPAHDSCGGVLNALLRKFRAASYGKKLHVLNACSDLVDQSG